MDFGEHNLAADLPQEEPWVAEFDVLIKDYADNVYHEGDPRRSRGIDEETLRAFIQKTLEADRKERVGVVVERVERAMIMGGLNALQKLYIHNALEGLSEDVMK